MTEIKNRELTVSERNWLNDLVQCKFLYREKFIKQLNSAHVKREYTDYYISIIFEINDNNLQIPIQSGVPIEMRVFRKQGCPVQFLLHVVGGYATELEIISADSSKIKGDISAGKKEIVLDKEIIEKNGYENSLLVEKF